jgi:ELWxxDGT repeat protein
LHGRRGFFEPSEPNTLSSATDGTFTIADAPDGSYIIRQLNPLDHVSAAAYPLTISGATQFSNANFGNFPLVYNGTDGDDARGRVAGRGVAGGVQIFSDALILGVGDKFYFIARTTTLGDELWVSDGTETNLWRAGTFVADEAARTVGGVCPAPGGSDPPHAGTNNARSTRTAPPARGQRLARRRPDRHRNGRERPHPAFSRR